VGGNAAVSKDAPFKPLNMEERFQEFQSFRWFQRLKNPTGNATFGERIAKITASENRPEDYEAFLTL
jgi:hypothetical protein